MICPPGTYSNGTQDLPVNEITECYTCPVGAECPNEAESNYTLCAIGYAQDRNGSTYCNRCMGGTYQNKAGQALCLECPGGFCCPQPPLAESWGSNQTFSCLPGSFSAPASEACTLCPAGTFEPTRESSECSGVCPAGEYSELGSIECTVCPANTYNDQAQNDGCTTCPDGKSVSLLIYIYIYIYI